MNSYQLRRYAERPTGKSSVQTLGEGLGFRAQALVFSSKGKEAPLEKDRVTERSGSCRAANKEDSFLAILHAVFL